MSEEQIVSEVVGCLARTWVLLGAPKDYKKYIYVEGEWVEITVRYNGEMEIPKRRAGDKTAEEPTS